MFARLLLFLFHAAIDDVLLFAGMPPLLALAEVARPAVVAGAGAEVDQEDPEGGAADERDACLLCCLAAESPRMRSRFKLFIMVLSPVSTSFCRERSCL